MKRPFTMVAETGRCAALTDARSAHNARLGDAGRRSFVHIGAYISGGPQFEARRRPPLILGAIWTRGERLPPITVARDGFRPAARAFIPAEPERPRAGALPPIPSRRRERG